MKTITSLSLCVNNKSRSNISLDGVFFCSLDNLIVLKYSLKEGDKITEEKLALSQEENEYSTAFDKALNYIARYKKTKKQTIEYLTKKGYLYSLAIKVVNKLQEYGYIDDSDYAQSFARQNSKNKGKMLIQMQLRAKGIDKNTAESAVNELEDETPIATQIAQKYMRNKQITRENLAKCYRYLLSKGFSFESAKNAISSIKDTEDDY